MSWVAFLASVLSLAGPADAYFDEGELPISCVDLNEDGVCDEFDAPDGEVQPYSPEEPPEPEEPEVEISSQCEISAMCMPGPCPNVWECTCYRSDTREECASRWWFVGPWRIDCTVGERDDCADWCDEQSACQ